ENPPRLAEQCRFELVYLVEIDAVVREMFPGPEGGRDQPVTFEQFGAEEHDLARERGERLVRRAARPGRAERKDLPPRVLHLGKCFGPAVGIRAEVADSERAGETGRVKQHPGGAREYRRRHSVLFGKHRSRVSCRDTANAKSSKQREALAPFSLCG